MRSPFSSVEGLIKILKAETVPSELKDLEEFSLNSEASTSGVYLYIDDNGTKKKISLEELSSIITDMIINKIGV